MARTKTLKEHLVLIALLFPMLAHGETRQPGVVDLHSVDTSIEVRMMYAQSNNFTGRVVDGYLANKCYLSKEAAEALKKAQAKLVKRGMSLSVRDCYRPIKAVKHFMRWAKEPEVESSRQKYYPSLKRSDLIPQGYIAEKSGHSRASTVDITVTRDGRELDMGTAVDYFGVEAHTNNPKLTPEQASNRKLLLEALQPDFVNYDKEWWHFTLRKEPFKEGFDFNVD